MSERPGGHDRSDEPGFGWLYGGRDGAGEPGPSENPDATRVLPVQPRPAAGAPAPGTPSAPVPPPYGPGGPGSPGVPPPTGPGGPTGPTSPGGPRLPRPRLRPRFRVRYVLALLPLYLAYLIVVPIMAWNDVDKVAFEPSGDRPGDQPGTTYLLVGSDSRGNLTKAERRRYHTGDASGQRTDTIMLLHTGSGPNLLMSIPRDSLVAIPGHGTTKINAAYAFGGAKLLVRTIEQNTGIRIDQYVEIGLGGVVDIVDAVGGITICPTFDMRDRLAGLNIKKGCQDADGVTALGYARSRHTDPRFGDITRAKHQREVVSAVGKKVLSPWTFVNPFRYWGVVHAAPSSFAVGEGMSPVRAGLWAMAMNSVNGKSGLTCGVPISDLAVHWDPTRSKKMFAAIIDDDTESIGKDLCSPTGLPKAITG